MGNETRSPSVARRLVHFFSSPRLRDDSSGLNDGWTTAGRLRATPPQTPPIPTSEGGGALQRRRELRSVQVVYHARFGTLHMTGGGGASLAAPG